MAPSSRSLMLMLALSALLVHCVAADRREHTCIHGSRRDQLITGVQQRGRDYVKRQSRQPMRFSTFPDSTITADLPDSKRQMIMNEVVPAVLEFLSLTLSVTPLTQPLLLDTQCSSEGFFLTPTGRQCAGVCEPTMCGTVRVPDQHLKACRQCNNDQSPPPNCPFGTPSSDQPGVANSDYALYISADQSACPGGDVLAFAGACQLESSQDRPIAGFINFCPTTLEGQDTAYLFSVAKHELFHALAFSSQLYPYWRDRNGDPRTQRDENGNPPFDSTGAPVADTSTVRTLTYTSWRTASGPTQHTVTALVTEAIAREGQTHFGYSGLEGVELENQGGEGTEFQHWEKRLLGNEAMTGVFTFDPVFSRISLALMEDSGWYSVDYSSASPLLWGQGKGQSFVEEGCGNLVLERNDDSNPFCGVRDSSNQLGCTLDRGAVAQCNRVSFTSELARDFQYFEGAPRDGGSIQVTDFCPIYRAFTYETGQDTNCSDAVNQPLTENNVRGETYGEGSRCIGQGREWNLVSGGFRYSSRLYGGGCYQYQCSADGVTINVLGIAFQCSCEGEEHIVDISSGSDCWTGSIICPSCASICYDQPGTCSSEPATCYGKVVETTERACSRTVGSARDPVGGASATPLASLITLVIITTVTLLM